VPHYEETDFKFLTENSVDIICSAGMDGRLRYVSPSSFLTLGWSPEEMRGKAPEEFIFPEDIPVLVSARTRIFAPSVDNSPSTMRMLKKGGGVVWMETNARLAREPNTGEPREVVLVMRDISERKRMEDKLSALAMTDGLTGILNRRAFDEALGREYRRALRESEPIALLLIDIDHFKQFNDQYGHLAGDDCLRAVASAMSGAVRATDLTARYGGEEIAIILPKTGMAGAAMVAERVRASVERLRIPHEGNPEGGKWVTVSVGASASTVKSSDTADMLEGLLLATDNALYKAKNGGRNRVETSLLEIPSSS